MPHPASLPVSLARPAHWSAATLIGAGVSLTVPPSVLAADASTMAKTGTRYKADRDMQSVLDALVG